MLSVLLIDDDPDLLEIIRLQLGDEPDLSLTTCNSPAGAIDLALSQKFDSIVCDYSMPGINGYSLLQHLRSRGCTARFILYSAKEPDDEIAYALTHGVDGYLQRLGNPETEIRELKRIIRTSDSK
ncbi:MAG: response regulator [Methanoregula sp.]|nr:response regulator [Methanoregula sp.]